MVNMCVNDSELQILKFIRYGMFKELYSELNPNLIKSNPFIVFP